MRPKPRVPLWRWATWWVALGVAIVIFYVLLTPLWMGLRAAAWLAEFRARRRRASLEKGTVQRRPSQLR